MAEFLPITFANKVNNPELQALYASLNTNEYVSAENVNLIKNAINELFELQNEIGSGQSVKHNIVDGEIISNALNAMYIVYEDFTVAGKFENSGKAVVMDGALVIEGTGEVELIGTGELIFKSI